MADLAKATDWYSRAFGVAPYFNEAFYVGFNISGYELGLIPDDTPAEKKVDGVNTYWGVDNVEKEYDRLMAMGAAEQEKPHNVGGELVVPHTSMKPFMWGST